MKSKKVLKRISAVVISTMMVCSISIPAFADEAEVVQAESFVEQTNGGEESVNSETVDSNIVESQSSDTVEPIADNTDSNVVSETLDESESDSNTVVNDDVNDLNTDSIDDVEGSDNITSDETKESDIISDDDNQLDESSDVSSDTDTENVNSEEISESISSEDTSESDIIVMSDEEAEVVTEESHQDWNDMEHTVVEYNTWDEYDDALSACYTDETNANFHVYSEMPAHLNEGGGEFTSGISVVFNDNWNTAFYPRFIVVDDAGNLDWNPQLSNLPDGTYHLYIASTDAWHTSPTIDEANSMDLLYGEAYLSIGTDLDEMTWNLDLGMIANKLGVSQNELQELGVQYSRLGQQWTRCAGTPIGHGSIPLGMTCVFAPSIIFYFKRKYKWLNGLCLLGC